MRPRLASSLVATDPAAPAARSPGTARERGFALLITITLLGFLVLLLVSLASLTRVETQVASNNLQLAQARQNALLGLQIAIGELQKHAGPDQRITAPATTVYPSKNLTTATGELFTRYRARAQTADRDTYLTSAERTQWETDIRTWWNSGNRNPYWTAVFNSSLRRDGQTGPNQYGEPKRDQLPVWLVSGNERIAFNPTTATTYPAGYLTPDVDITTRAAATEIVSLVTSSPLGSSPAASGPISTDSVDGLDATVRVIRQPLADPNAPANALGHYAYWVSDESTKANFTVRDPYYSNNTPASEEYRNRLQVPQRVGWERLTGFAQVFDGGSALALDDPSFEKALSSTQLPLLDPNFSNPVKRNFHHLSTYSRSLHTDTVLGGLKKDLTVFFEGAGPSVSTVAPIFDRSLYSTQDPRFGASNGGFPISASTTNLPTWGQIKDWADSSAASATSTIPVSRGRAPVIANFQIFYGFSHKDGVIQMHWVPCIVLWNPFDTALAQTQYRLKWRHNFSVVNFGVATRGLTPNVGEGGTSSGYLVHKLNPVDWYVPTAPIGKGYQTEFSSHPAGTSAIPNYRFSPFDKGTSAVNELVPAPSDARATWVTYEFNTGFAAGQAKIFTVDGQQEVVASGLHDGTEIVRLTNDFSADFPASYFFKVAEIADSSLTKTATPTFAHEVRWYAALTGEAKSAVSSMELFLSSGTSLWRSEYQGNPGNFMRHVNRVDESGAAKTISNPATWRILRHYDIDHPTNSTFTSWLYTPKGSVQSRNVRSPLVAMYTGRVQPFTAVANDIYRTPGGMNTIGTTRFMRAFANFNLAAPSLDFNLDLEGARNPNTDNNFDHFAVNQLVYSEDSTSVKWDNNQASVSPDGMEGYTLLSWINPPSPTQTPSQVKPLSRLPLRQVRRASSKILSLGQLQQANLAQLAWQPGFAVGNSEASPYVDRGSVAGIESYQISPATINSFAAHWSFHHSDARTHPNDTRNRYLDLSYLLNESLWDRYFLSSIPQSTAVALDNSSPLDNSRHRFHNTTGLTAADVRDFNLSAAYLQNLGALNVNSTSVEAWKALLTAFRGLRYESDDRASSAVTTSIPVSRTLDPAGGHLQFTFSGKNSAHVGASPTGGNNRDYSRFFTGFRYLTDDMIQTLAERIVDEVRLRGPFYSLSDFVNRRLVSPDRSNNEWLQARTSNQSTTDGYTHTFGTGSSNYDSLKGLAGINGALQRAINVSGINGGVNYPLALDLNDRAFRVELNPTSLSSTNQPMQIYPSIGHYLDAEHLAGVPTGEANSLLSHAPGFVTQADILGMIGPALTARGDTFLIRTYGDTINPATGELAGRAWLEAVVQRTATPVTPAGTTGADRFTPTGNFGRRFEVISMRWLSPSDL